MSQFCRSGSSKAYSAVLYGADIDPHQRSWAPRAENQKMCLCTGDREGEEREIEKISADDGTGKGERLQNLRVLAVM